MLWPKAGRNSTGIRLVPIHDTGRVRPWICRGVCFSGGLMVSSALRSLLCGALAVFVALRGTAAPTDAWPGDTYTGPLTPVSGTLGGAPMPLLVYGAYPVV